MSNFSSALYKRFYSGRYRAQRIRDIPVKMAIQVYLYLLTYWCNI